MRTELICIRLTKRERELIDKISEKNPYLGGPSTMARNILFSQLTKTGNVDEDKKMEELYPKFQFTRLTLLELKTIFTLA